MRLALVMATIGAVAAGCGSLFPTPFPTAVPTPPPRSMTIHVTNATPIAVSVVINGQNVGDVRRAGPAFAISTATLGGPPWTIEARGGASNRALVTLLIAGLDDDPGVSRGRYIDLTCGRIWVWAGQAMPDAPVGPAGDEPGDCP